MKPLPQLEYIFDIFWYSLILNISKYLARWSPSSKENEDFWSSGITSLSTLFSFKRTGGVLIDISKYSTQTQCWAILKVLFINCMAALFIGLVIMAFQQLPSLFLTDQVSFQRRSCWNLCLFFQQRLHHWQLKKTATTFMILEPSISGSLWSPYVSFVISLLSGRALISMSFRGERVEVELVDTFKS